MKNLSISIFILSFLITIIHSKNEKNETVKEVNTTETDENYNDTQEFEEIYEAPEDEIDKILFCSVFFQDFLDKETKKIDEVAKELKLNDSDKLYDKIGSDILENCYNTTDMKTVNEYFKNGVYINEVFPEKFKQYTNVSFEKYKTKKDVELTMNQQILSFKLTKALDKYKKLKEEEKKYESSFNEEDIRIGNVSIQNISKGIKVGILLIVFGLLFGGTLYFLKSLNKKKENEKDKKKKKKN